MDTIAITGAHGMLGSDLREIAQMSYRILAYDKVNLDITNIEQMKLKLAQDKPDLIINCAAYTSVDQAEHDLDRVYQINAYGAEYLARISHGLDIPLVHISTNFVFDGDKVSPYREDDPAHNPVNVYGASKLRGEELIVQYNPKHYIIRTSHLFGANGNHFIKTILRLAREKSTLSVVNDQRGNPTYTRDLAEAIVHLVSEQAPYGIYHLTNSTPDNTGITWYQLAQDCLNLRNIQTPIIPVDSNHFPSIAKRPLQGTLDNTKRPSLRSYTSALIEYLHTHPYV